MVSGPDPAKQAWGHFQGRGRNGPQKNPQKSVTIEYDFLEPKPIRRLTLDQGPSEKIVVGQMQKKKGQKIFDPFKKGGNISLPRVTLCKRFKKNPASLLLPAFSNIIPDKTTKRAPLVSSLTRSTGAITVLETVSGVLNVAETNPPHHNPGRKKYKTLRLTNNPLDPMSL